MALLKLYTRTCEVLSIERTKASFPLWGRGAFSFGTQFASLTIGILEKWNSGMLGSGLRLREENGVMVYWKIPPHTEVEMLREWADSYEPTKSVWGV